MVKTHGLTHVGLVEYYRDDEQIQVQRPGPYDVLAFEKRDVRDWFECG